MGEGVPAVTTAPTSVVDAGGSIEMTFVLMCTGSPIVMASHTPRPEPVVGFVLQ
jgi:hypothetical protein